MWTVNGRVLRGLTYELTGAVGYDNVWGRMKWSPKRRHAPLLPVERMVSHLYRNVEVLIFCKSHAQTAKYGALVNINNAYSTPGCHQMS